MNARQRKAQHERRRRHQEARRSPSGQGRQAGRPPGSQPLRAGKTQPTERRLRTVHDMARAARYGRDDAERAWRRAFKGIHAIGYKADGSPSSAGGLQRMTPVTPSHGPEHRSGSQKRKQRGRRRVMDWQVRHRENAVRFDLGYVELRPGLWTRDLERAAQYVAEA